MNSHTNHHHNFKKQVHLYLYHEWQEHVIEDGIF